MKHETRRLETSAERTLRVSGGSGGIEAESRVPEAATPGGGEESYERRLGRITERLDPLMAFLGVVFALIAAFELADPGLSSRAERSLEIALLSIWAIFLLDFLAKLVSAPAKLSFVRRHWLAVLMLAVPALRVLRFGALLRLGRALPAARVVSSSYRASGVARNLLRSRASYLGALATIMSLAVAELAWLAEREHDTFAGFSDALLWSASCVLAMQGEPVPITTFGRIVMLIGFATGVLLVASLAGVVGSYLLEDRRERQTDDA